MLCAAALVAQQIGGKAARDALFLSNFPSTSLPVMMIAAGVFAILLVALGSRVMATHGPWRLVRSVLLGSAVLLMFEWLVTFREPRAAAVALYLHIAGPGAFLMSGFWLLVNEALDPWSVRRRIGRIAAAATLGGLAGGLLAERVGAHLSIGVMLPPLAAMQLFCAWRLRALTPLQRDRAPGAAIAADLGPKGRPETTPGRPVQPRPARTRLLRDAPHLSNLAVLVLAATMGAALLDYVFKSTATAMFTDGALLMRFFAMFYTGAGLIAFLLQSIVSRLPADRISPALTVATHPASIVIGGVMALAMPGLWTAALARGAESVLRSSLFRSGYEVFFAPIAPRVKRTARTIVDVGLERLGDLFGAGLAGIFLFTLPAGAARAAMLAFAAALGLAALGVARRLEAGYVRELERRLLSGAVKVDLDHVTDPLAHLVMHRTMSTCQVPPFRSMDATQASARAAGSPDVTPVPVLISRLGSDESHQEADKTLRAMADRVTDQLVAALLDPSVPLAVRRRVPRVLSTCRSQQAVDGLLRGLMDRSFLVRLRCGRALASIRRREPAVRIDQGRVFGAVLRETQVGRVAWESPGPIDELEDSEDRSPDVDSPFVDDIVRARASRSMEHVFTLLSLALDRQPLQLAFRALYTHDPMLRGIALEYLEVTLPSDIRAGLWPFLGDERPPTRSQRGRAEILAELLQSRQTIRLKLDDLRPRHEEEE